MDTLINCAVLVKEKQLVNNNQPNWVLKICFIVPVSVSTNTRTSFHKYPDYYPLESTLVLVPGLVPGLVSGKFPGQFPG